jgi:hypothetical protein
VRYILFCQEESLTIGKTAMEQLKRTVSDVVDRNIYIYRDFDAKK